METSVRGQRRHRSAQGPSSPGSLFPWSTRHLLQHPGPPHRGLLCLVFVTESSERVIFLNPFEHRNTAPVSVCAAGTSRGAGAALESADRVQLRVRVTVGAGTPPTSAAVTLLKEQAGAAHFSWCGVQGFSRPLFLTKRVQLTSLRECRSHVRPGQGAAGVALAQPRSPLGCAF